MKVLLIEDDLQLAKIVKKILETKGFNVTLVTDGDVALENIKSNSYDLYLIDINIPGINGLELVKYIRNMYKEGIIIMITASIDEYYFQKAYEYGCDDYIKKPFHATELELRINRLINEQKNIKFDDYTFDFDEMELYKNSKRIPLRKKEKKFLYLLLKNINKTVKAEKIIDFVWDKHDKNNYPIRQLVNELRKKFDKDYIQTVVGIGYRFESKN